MRWSLSHGEWILRRDDGKLLGHVYRVKDEWAAETEGPGLTTGPGSLDWAQEQLLNFCHRWQTDKIYDHATTR